MAMKWKAMLTREMIDSPLGSDYLHHRKPKARGMLARIWMTDVLYRLTLTTGMPDYFLSPWAIMDIRRARKPNFRSGNHVVFPRRRMEWK